MSGSLVIGASGQVGEHLIRYLHQIGREVYGTYFSTPKSGLRFLDIRDPEIVADFFQKFQPDIIYLPAALTNVEYCEKKPEESYQINVQGTCIVTLEANRVGAKVVFFSSDYVFDGKNGPYSETSATNPISVYGYQKLCGEHYIAIHSQDFLIIRTTIVYGWESQGKNFVQRLVETLNRGENFRAPIDQVGSPTYAPNLAEAVVELTDKEAKGLYHVVGPALVNRYEFARAAALAFNLDPAMVVPVTTTELGQAAKRPLLAGMKVDKVQKVIHTPLMDYKSGLRAMTYEKREVM